jgi:hypothetical protein
MKIDVAKRGLDMITRNRTEVFGIASVVCFFILLLMVGSCHAASVDVGGWNFTADLGAQWRLGTEPMEDGQDIPSMKFPDVMFTGVMKSNAFWLPRDSTVITPTEFPSLYDPKQNDIIATVDLWVNKVPKEEKGWTARDILADFYGPDIDGRRKEIEFNGRPALLWEGESSDLIKDGELVMPAISQGEIIVMMTEETIVTISANALPKSNLRPWDVIEKFTISPM